MGSSHKPFLTDVLTPNRNKYEDNLQPKLDHYQLSAQVYFGNCILYQYLIVFLIMKVALTFCILSLAFLAIFSSESAGKMESLQNVHNKRALNHKADSRKAVNKR